MKWATLGRRRYRVWHDATLMGFADIPAEEKENIIYIDPALGPRDHLETVCHEIQHALNPEKGEAWIERAGKQQARLLRGLGYRRERDG